MGKLQQIRVVSAMPGSGKTTWVFEHIKNNKHEPWIFVSPYLQECGGYDSSKDINHNGRIRDVLPDMNFKLPDPLHRGDTKSRAFKRLIRQGENISTTHQLWRMLDDECAGIIEEKGYNIIIDESLNLIETYEAVDQNDIRGLIRSKMIILNEVDGSLKFNDDDYPNYKGIHYEVKKLCDIGALYLYGDEVVIHQVPPKVMMSAKEVIVLTYGFEHSIMGAWCEVCNIPYYIDKSVVLYKSNNEIIDELLHRINLIPIPASISRYDGYMNSSIFTKSWFDKVDSCEEGEEILDKIKSSVVSVVKNKFDKGNIFWTTFKDYKVDLQGLRYTRGKNIKLDGKEWKRDPFVAKNMRASNEYRDCTNCIYLVDVRLNPYLFNYLKGKGGKSLREDIYALLEMIQLVFRGAVRNQEGDPLGNHLNLLVGSPRMYRLLNDWLNGKIVVN